MVFPILGFYVKITVYFFTDWIFTFGIFLGRHMSHRTRGISSRQHAQDAKRLTCNPEERESRAQPRDTSQLQGEDLSPFSPRLLLDTIQQQGFRIGRTVTPITKFPRSEYPLFQRK